MAAMGLIISFPCLTETVTNPARARIIAAPEIPFLVLSVLKQFSMASLLALGKKSVGDILEHNRLNALIFLALN